MKHLHVLTKLQNAKLTSISKLHHADRNMKVHTYIIKTRICDPWQEVMAGCRNAATLTAQRDKDICTCVHAPINITYRNIAFVPRF